MPGSITKDDVFAFLPAAGNAGSPAARTGAAATQRPSHGAPAGGLFQRLAAWRDRRRTARELAALPDSVLRDIGVTRAEIDHAALAAASLRRPA